MFVMKVSVPSQTTAADWTSRLKEAVDSSPAVSYILDSELHIQHCNPAWDKFARENGAPNLNARNIVGRVLLEFIPDVLRPAYSAAFSQVLTTSNVWEKCYECSSPDLYRLFACAFTCSDRRTGTWSPTPLSSKSLTSAARALPRISI
jgi:hypothetical protein